MGLAVLELQVGNPSDPEVTQTVEFLKALPCSSARIA